MPRSLLAASLMAVFALAACGAEPGAPSVPPSVSPPSPSALPSLAPPPSVKPPSTAKPPAPSQPAPTQAPATPKPTQVAFTADEQYLIDGLMRGVIGCDPARNDLPPRAIAGIDCSSDDPGVARVGFYLFRNDADMLDAYLARMTAERVALESGNCLDGEHEGAYIPGEGDEIVPYRVGCFLNDQGYANLRATLPGAHVYLGVLGRADNMPYLDAFAFWGDQDTPARPTLWVSPRWVRQQVEIGGGFVAGDHD